MRRFPSLHPPLAALIVFVTACLAIGPTAAADTLSDNLSNITAGTESATGSTWLAASWGLSSGAGATWFSYDIYPNQFSVTTTRIASLAAPDPGTVFLFLSGAVFVVGLIAFRSKYSLTECSDLQGRKYDET